MAPLPAHRSVGEIVSILRRRLSGLLGLLAPQLLLGRGLGLPLGLPDGGDAGDGGLPEIGAVAGLGDLAGDGLVGAIGRKKGRVVVSDAVIPSFPLSYI